MVPFILRTLLLLAGLSQVASGATIIVVRHAERNAGMTPDVLLSPKGEERAKQLAAMLKDANIHACYATEVKRTQQTAEPTAEQFHLKTTIVTAQDVDGLLTILRGLPDDVTVLVVGNTTTVPLIVEKLGGHVAPLADTEYDRLIIVVTGKSKPTVVTLRY
jgi:phosphohistidine phosphatase SixA